MKLYEQYLGINVPIYHYIFDESILHKILSDGKLLPANKNLNPKMIKIYGQRALDHKMTGASKDNSDLENAKIYWEDTYNFFYKDAVKKPYKNYGIYMTTIDLVGIRPIKYRFKLNFNDLPGDTVIQIWKNVKLVNSESDILRMSHKYEDKEIVKKIWDKEDSAKFKHLPQIVNFSDYIKVTRKDLDILK